MEQHDQGTGTKKDLVLYRLKKSGQDLQSSKVLLSIEDYKGALANFNKNYVKTSVFPREIGRKIGRAEEIRHASDYDDFYIAIKEETEQLIATANEFLLLAEKYCSEQFTKQEGEL